ncbi:MAG: SDR family oxidoreductase [Proteobacteria bacterium]|nr:SDR family oxidoreductase [Pseudomonadota bacterium]
MHDSPPASDTTGHALVTGASAGIGAAMAREYARRGKPLILTARREDRLIALADELEARVPCTVLAADLADPAVPEALFRQVSELGLHVDTLVNNAGYGVGGHYLAQPWPTHAQFLQVMVNAPCELAHLFLPAMQERRYGRILNVASLAGRVPGSPGHTLYGAAKALLVTFSQSLALENTATGVHVCALCPGFTYSEFHDITGTRERVSKLPRWMWMRADDVARIGVDAVERGQIVCIPGRVNRAIKSLFKLLPDGLALRTMQRRAKQFRNQDA